MKYLKKTYADIPYPSTLNPNSTIADAGCGVCCVAYISNQDVEDIAILCLEKGYRTNKGTAMNNLIQYLNSNGCHFKLSNKEIDVYEAIKNTNQIIINVSKCEHFNCGHFIIVIDEYTIFDPDIGIRNISIQEILKSVTNKKNPFYKKELK